jgi:hypothetical protein
MMAYQSVAYKRDNKAYRYAGRRTIIRVRQREGKREKQKRRKGGQRKPGQGAVERVLHDLGSAL